MTYQVILQKKVKATLLEETSATTPTEPLPTQTASTQNDEKLELPKISQGISIPKQKSQESLQQPDSTQVNEHTNEQNKDIVIDKKDDMTPITSNTKQHIMVTDATSNATIEVANKSIDLRDEELDATKWNYNTILQAFSSLATIAEFIQHKFYYTKILVITARRLQKYYFFYKIPSSWIDIKELEATKTKGAKPQLPKDKKTLLENIKIIDEALQIPITKYNMINSILEWLREKYEYDRIPAYLLELPNQPCPK
ncbi:30726_t:CDS:2 [Gigaspora margarita]|uniref:30726_t:CDS:1 n=1 Tax=Gigaspora margarita TaxID=4874 RepID=A0ABN7VE76_GIGMA|nr:30726_t:CDS:2 [Gigaspora margarita]